MQMRRGKIVRIRYVQEYQVNGTWYRYYRRKGAPKVPLALDLSPEELFSEVERLNRLHFKPVPRAGTLRLLVQEYKANSNHYRELRERTRKDYERVFGWLGDALDAPLVDITTPEVAKVRDKARDQHEPKFANQVVTVIKKVFTYGVEYGIADRNPAEGVSRATGGKKRQNRPWTPQEAATALESAPVGIRKGIALAVMCGLREGDVVSISRTADKGDWLEHVQGKTRRPVLLYVTATLRRILDAEPHSNGVTLIAKDDGNPWRQEGFKTAFYRYRDRLVGSGLIRAGLTFHGLRHTAATILAEAGYDETEYRHLLGHGPRTVSAHYAATAERKKLLIGMAETIESALIEGRGNTAALPLQRNRSGR